MFQVVLNTPFAHSNLNEQHHQNIHQQLHKYLSKVRLRFTFRFKDNSIERMCKNSNAITDIIKCCRYNKYSLQFGYLSNIYTHIITYIVT